MNNEKGILLFYDWFNALMCLSGDELRKMLVAMIEYHRDNTPPPEFEGYSAVIGSFIFPQIRRQKESLEAKARKKRY